MPGDVAAHELVEMRRLHESNLLRFFLGLFGMALAAKVFNTLAELSLGQAIQRAVSRWLGNKE